MPSLSTQPSSSSISIPPRPSRPPQLPSETHSFIAPEFAHLQEPSPPPRVREPAFNSPCSKAHLKGKWHMPIQEQREQEVYETWMERSSGPISHTNGAVNGKASSSIPNVGQDPSKRCSRGPSFIQYDMNDNLNGDLEHHHSNQFATGPSKIKNTSPLTPNDSANNRHPFHTTSGASSSRSHVYDAFDLDHAEGYPNLVTSWSQYEESSGVKKQYSHHSDPTPESVGGNTQNPHRKVPRKSTESPSTKSPVKPSVPSPQKKKSSLVQSKMNAIYISQRKETRFEGPSNKETIISRFSTSEDEADEAEDPFPFPSAKRQRNGTNTPYPHAPIPERTSVVNRAKDPEERYPKFGAFNGNIDTEYISNCTSHNSNGASGVNGTTSRIPKLDTNTTISHEYKRQGRIFHPILPPSSAFDPSPPPTPKHSEIVMSSNEKPINSSSVATLGPSPCRGDPTTFNSFSPIKNPNERTLANTIREAVNEQIERASRTTTKVPDIQERLANLNIPVTQSQRQNDYPNRNQDPTTKHNTNPNHVASTSANANVTTIIAQKDAEILQHRTALPRKTTELWSSISLLRDLPKMTLSSSPSPSTPTSWHSFHTARELQDQSLDLEQRIEELLGEIERGGEGWSRSGSRSRHRSGSEIERGRKTPKLVNAPSYPVLPTAPLFSSSKEKGKQKVGVKEELLESSSAAPFEDVAKYPTSTSLVPLLTSRSSVSTPENGSEPPTLDADLQPSTTPFSLAPSLPSFQDSPVYIGSAEPRIITNVGRDQVRLTSIRRRAGREPLKPQQQAPVQAEAEAVLVEERVRRVTSGIPTPAPTPPPNGVGEIEQSTTPPKPIPASASYPASASTSIRSHSPPLDLPIRPPKPALQLRTSKFVERFSLDGPAMLASGSGAEIPDTEEITTVERPVVESGENERRTSDDDVRVKVGSQEVMAHMAEEENVVEEKKKKGRTVWMGWLTKQVTSIWKGIRRMWTPAAI
ncbi:uncharacterized protein BDR25DRAFT_312125 [Lindgomyces ingoldianus]|uniref:Uncharacterized protein n=1 Tax=Lindgomyces ingoldianus TaxID=673940 RepID=A0ACB6R3X0_9PLEO|nr:uncharacterized protein BDR25DRAFT_312125 [Lindgomyces ingoldianus]KAF2473964.1 hypothetical protein BDR25DRAFT_312125 [Lindgomyces ingoldianus]